jgi:hypothetical protein
MSRLAEIKRLADLHRELLSLAEVSLIILNDDRLDDLMPTWERRRRVHDRLMAAGRRLEPLWRDWPAGVDDMDQDQISQAEEIISYIKRTASRTLEVDKQAAGRMEAMMAETRQGLDRLSTGKKLMNAYHRRPQPHGGPFRLSRQG